MVYKISAPIHTYENLEIIEGHTFHKLEDAHQRIEKALNDKDINFSKNGNIYLNSDGGTILEIIKN